MTNENQNTEHPRLVRVKCLKNFNLEGRQGMFIHGTEQEITEKEVEFLQKMGLTSQPFIEIIDPDYNKPAPQPVSDKPVTWTQTHGGKGIGGPVVAGLDAPNNVPAPAEPVKEPEPVVAGPDVPEDSDAEPEPAKEGTKPRLNLKKK
jgi:hypothetical protein